MRRWLNQHRTASGLFAVALASLGLGIALVAQPGHGLWGNVGWVLTAVGVLCLVGAVAFLVANGETTESSGATATAGSTTGDSSPVQTARGHQVSQAGRDQAARDIHNYYGGSEPAPPAPEAAGGDPFKRALAEAAHELWENTRMITRAREQGHFPHSQTLSVRWAQPLRQQLADRDLVDEERTISRAYGLCEDLRNELSGGRSWAGPEGFPERVAPPVDEEQDRYDLLLSLIDAAQATIQGLRQPQPQAPAIRLGLRTLINDSHALEQEAAQYMGDMPGRTLTEEWTAEVTTYLAEVISPGTAERFLAVATGNQRGALHARRQFLEALLQELQ